MDKFNILQAKQKQNNDKHYINEYFKNEQLILSDKILIKTLNDYKLRINGALNNIYSEFSLYYINNILNTNSDHIFTINNIILLCHKADDVIRKLFIQILNVFFTGLGLDDIIDDIALTMFIYIFKYKDI